MNKPEEVISKVYVKQPENYLVFVYSCHEVNKWQRNQKYTFYVVSYIDIEMSVKSQYALKQKVQLLSMEEFTQQFAEQPSDINTLYLMKQLANIVGMEANLKLTEYLEDLNTTNAILDYCGVPLGSDPDMKDTLFKFMYDSIDGDGNELNKEEMNKVYQNLNLEIMKNLDMNLEDTRDLERFKRDIEYTMISSLPDNITISDMELNFDKVITIMKKIKEQRDQNNGGML